MMADKFRTGSDGVTGHPVLISLSVPSALWFQRELSDLLADMTSEDNWQAVGSVTIAEATQAAQDMYWSMSTMVGQIMPYVTANTPDNMLPCDGSTHNRVDYPVLYGVLDAHFIVDADTFVTPDLRGRTIIGAGTGTGLTARVVGASGGQETHTLTVSEMPAHHHSYDPVITGDLDTEAVGVPQPNAAQIIPFVTENTYDEGGGEAHNNMQPFAVLKYGVIAW